MTDPHKDRTPSARRVALILGTVFVVLVGVVVGSEISRPRAGASEATQMAAASPDSPLPESSPSEPTGPVLSPIPTRKPPAVTPPTPTPTPVPTVAPASAVTTPTPPVEPPAVAELPPVHLPERLAAITVTDGLRVRSAPGVADDSTRHEPPLPRGTRLRIVEGPVYASDYWWYRVDEMSVHLDGGIEAGWVASADHDGTPWIGAAREACLDFEFPPRPVSVDEFSELATEMVGTWQGCAMTPWTQPYWVTLEFREDGTYSGFAEVGPDGSRNPAFYYGTDEDAAGKRYRLHDLPDSRLAWGDIDIAWFDDASITRGDLRNVALMGDQLQFEFFHLGYGPVEYRLYRQG